MLYIYFISNVGDNLLLGKNNPLWVEKNKFTDELIPYVLVKKGLIAKLSRPVYYQLTELLDIKNIKNILHNGIYSRKEFFILDKPSLRKKYL